MRNPTPLTDRIGHLGHVTWEGTSTVTTTNTTNHQNVTAAGYLGLFIGALLGILLLGGIYYVKGNVAPDNCERWEAPAKLPERLGGWTCLDLESDLGLID